MNWAHYIRTAAAITTAILGAAAILVALQPWTPWAIRHDLDMTRTDMARLATIVEASAIINSEPVGSSDYQRALLELREARRPRVIQH